MRYLQTIIICCLLLSCTSPSLTPQKMPPIAEIQWWKDRFQNSALLDLKIDLTACIESTREIDDSVWKLSSLPQAMSRVGVLLHPHPESIRHQWWGSNQDFPPKTLSVSVVPYITNQVGEKLVLLPEVNEKLSSLKERQSHQLCRRDGNELRCDQPFSRFLPACAPVFDKLVNAYPHFYPIVLLSVDNDDDFQTLENFLEKSLIEQQLLEFTNSAMPVGKTEDMGSLLTRILDKNQAKFLEGLPFPVKITLPNETLPLEQLNHFIFNTKELSTKVTDGSERKSYFTLVYPNNIAGASVAGCNQKVGQNNTLVCEPKEYQVTDICQAETTPLRPPYKLVVISLSEGFGKQNQAIKNGLAEVFFQLQSTKMPFTLLASSGELYTF
ncbi:MAG: hypothetical protein BWK79_12120 [Beggiatoa sp. IS2]|nr:MAG: hypothetical protein BWK79_12120 [Beggiatoa sp. IS2]